MADDLLNGLLAKARGGDTSEPSSMDTPVLINIAPDQRKSLRYDSPELNDYASFVERRHGLPEGLLKAVKNIGEKSNSGQVSPKGARGVMQFMPATWGQYGKGDPTDPVASMDAAGAYFKDLLARYDGNVDAAVTEYNGGVKQARAVQAGGAPWVPETVQYLQRVRDALASRGTNAAPGRPAGMGVPIMTDPSIQPSRNLANESQAEERKRREFEEQGAFRRGLGVVIPQVKQAAGAGMAMVGSKTGSEGVQQYGLDLFGEGKKEAEAFEDPSASLSNVLEGKGNVADFAKYWAGYGLGQAVESAVTGIAGAAVGGLAGSAVPGAGNAAGAVSGFVGGVIGKGAVKKALAEGAEKILAKEIEAGVARGLTREAAEAAAAPVVKSWVSAETKKAGVRALAAAGASTGLYTQNAAMELGEIYGHYIDQMQQSGRPITQEDEDLALKSALAAAGVETLADLAGIGRLLGTGNKAAGGMLSTIGKEVARGVAREVPTEVGQTAIERFGKQQSLTDADAVRDYIDAAGGAAVPGAMFGGMSGVKRAMAPNSPLSNAANAAGGVPAAAVPGAVPPAAPGAGPAAGAPAGQGAPGGSTQDPLSAKVESLRPFLEDKDLIRSIRGLPELGPESVNELLAAWALARNPQTNPQIRERLLDQVGQFVDSVQNRPNWTFGKQPEPQQAPGMPGVPAVQAGQQGTAMAPTGQPQIGDSGMTLEGQAREVPPEQLKAPPKRALETQQAMQGRAQALAEYEQAFQDLVKAEALGASDQELQAKQQAVREAEAFKVQAEARLKEIRETIEGNRKLESERKRGAILDAVLSDPETANPAERFAAELKRQGFSDAAIQPSEMARIARFEDVKASGIGAGDDNVEPSAPNEMDVAGLIPERKPKQIQKPKKEVSNVRMQPGLADAEMGGERTETQRDQLPGDGASLGAGLDVRGERDLAGGDVQQGAASAVGQAEPVREAGSEQAPAVASQPAGVSATTQEVNDEGRDQQNGESRDSAPVRAAEGQGYAVPQPAGPWTAEELSDRADLIKSAGEYLAARDQGGQILTGAIDATLRDKDANLGLALPGMERNGLPASLAVTYDQDEYGDPGFAEEFRVEFGGEAVYISKVKLQDGDALAGIPPLVLSTGEELAAYRVDGLPNDLFDFVDAVEQAYAILAERASRSPKGQELDASIATQLEDRPEPTEAQKEAENYQKAHVSVLGLEISIETEKGGERSGTDKDGSRWSVTMPAQYGYIKGTMGADKDHVDIFLGPKPDNGKFFVINQTTPDGQKFDEHKVMLGYDSPEAAQADYLLSFSGDFGGKVFGSIAGPFDLEGFKALIPALAKAKPVAERVAEAADVKSAAEFEHNGVRIYPINVNVAGERKQMWGVESADNKAKREVGERYGFGDSLHETPGQAKEAADRQVRSDQERAEYQRRSEELSAKERENEAARKSDTINGFLDGKAPNTQELNRKALEKPVRLNGEAVVTVRQYIEGLHRDGELDPGSFEEPKVKPMSRTQFNRASQREQDAHEKKMREAGTKTVYTVNGFELGKTAYDYASYLLGKSNKKPEEVEGQSEKASKNSEESAGTAPEDLESAEPASVLAPTIQPFQHTKTGETIYSVKLPVQVSTPEYQAINRNAIKHKGRYSTFKAAGTIPGFHFRSEEDAKAFAADPVVAGVLAKYGQQQDAAPVVSSEKPEALEVPADLEAIFEGLDGGGLAKNRAEKAAASHPEAARINYVRENILDILQELEDSGLVKINCD